MRVLLNPSFRAGVTAVLFSASLFLFANTSATAQTPEVLTPGNAAVTGFADAPDDASVRFLDLGETGGTWANAIVDAPTTLSIPASEIGQVFGLALDDATPPNIYATATSAFGLRIEGSGANAKWGPGQFGGDDNSGPGSIWKIDGATGEASLFANVELNGTANSGAGLGNIAFDPVSQQLFVSDLDTGLIHRFGLDGNDLGTFDHGVTARPTTGLKPLPFDSKNRLDITSNDFKADDPKTWAFAAPGRTVWGLAVDGGRLYYAVGEGPQVWSVAITSQGDFGEDARLEFDLPASFSPNPISDITFTGDRRMILAQRGGHQSGTDKDHHRSGDNAVIVFSLEIPDDLETPSAWMAEPEVVPVGQEAPYRQGAGGVAIGHGYKDDGTIDNAACKASLWVTGDDITLEGAESIDGLQGQRAVEFTTTPEAPTDADFVKIFEGGADKRAGGVGDIAIYTNCAAEPLEELASYEEPTCPGDDPRCPIPWEPPVIDPDPEIEPEYKGPDLAIAKIAHFERCDKGDLCSFEVLVRNVGSVPYYGPITLEDTTEYNDPLDTYGPAPPWSCAVGDFISAFCRHPDTYLAPGDGVSVHLTFRIPDDWTEHTYQNCASLSWAPWQGYGDANPHNDKACDWAPVCQPGTPGCGPDLMIEQVSSGFCEVLGFCRLITRITNVGAEDYTGPLSFNVVDYTPELVLQNYASAVEWSCGASGAANYRCFSNPVTLTPGESREVTITLGLPTDYPEDSAHQCVELSNLPGGSDADAYNNYACQTFRICSEGSDCPADMSVTFSSRCISQTGGRCRIYAIAENVGNEPFSPPDGIFSTLNDLGPGASLLPPVDPQCADQGDGKATCSWPLTEEVPPGVRVFHSYTYDVSGVTDAVRENCVKIDWPEGQSDANPANDEYCGPVLICQANGGDCPIDLKVRPVYFGVCVRGTECEVLSPLVSNVGSDDFVGSFTARISGVPGLTPSSQELRVTPGQPIGQCAVFSPGIQCSSGEITLPGRLVASPSAYARMDYTIPLDYPQDQVEICLELTEVDGEDASQDNNRACTTFRIRDPVVPAAAEVDVGGDVAVTKRLLGACTKAGENCSYRVRVTNEGAAPIEGDIVIDDALAPASGTFVSASGQGVTAEEDGDGKAVLTLASASLEPGDSKALDVIFKMNADASGDVENCATVRALPGDGNPTNNKACVTVTLDETTVEPPPPPVPDGQLDVSLQLTGESSCQAGKNCAADITLTNVGSEPFGGPLTVFHSFEGAGARYGGGGNGFACSAFQTDNMQCTNADLTLAPGATATYPFNALLGKGIDGTYQNCAEIQWTRRGGSSDLALAQTKLNELGYDVGAVDGKLGAKTRNALLSYQRTSGLRQTGVLDPMTSRRLLGPPKQFNDVNSANDRDCLAVTVGTNCTGGRIWSGGACVCPGGLSFIKGKCVRPPVVCTADKILVNGRCVCPQGMTLQGGICQPPVVKGCPYKGQFSGRDGKCYCPSGQKVIGGVCKRPVTACTADKILVNGRCVCPKGMTLQGGICQPPIVKTCPYKGQFRGRDGKCYCPKGQKVIGGMCKKPVTKCTVDKILVHGKCVCRKGWTSKGGICVPPIVKTCPYKGQFKGRDGKCYCPKGQKVIGGVCKRPVTACTADKILVNGKCVCPKGMTLQKGICQTPPPKGCPYKGQFKGRDGKCYCPKGQKVISGQCKKPTTGPKPCSYKGQFRDRSGKCRCPSGQKVIKGQCRKPTSSLPPQIKDKIKCNDSLRKLGIC